MEVHDRWGTASFDLDPVAAVTGPFPHRGFLRAWWEHRGRSGELQLVDSGRGIVPLWRRNGEIRFAGDADVTDYHSPLGTGTADLIGAYAGTLDAGTRVRFDSLPAEAASRIVAALEDAGVTAASRRHELTAVVTLPANWPEWIGSLQRKARHEVRRKIRRFEASGATPALSRLVGPEAVATFADLHRKADGPKGMFMDTAMEAFFVTLHDRVGGVVDVVSSAEGVPVAAAFGFEDEGAYYLYNSAYDPAAADLSPGVILVTSLIRAAMRSGRHTFDFLKGDEGYKFRHGAVARPLYEVSATIGAAP